eukprot:1183876-Prorocentrum_minimum.AAC.1
MRRQGFYGLEVDMRHAWGSGEFGCSRCCYLGRQVSWAAHARAVVSAKRGGLSAMRCVGVGRVP